MKPPKLPYFKAQYWTTAKGKKKVAYYYRFPTKSGKKPIALGTDLGKAIQKWGEIHGVEIEKPRDGELSIVYNEYMQWAEKTALSGLAPRTIKDRKDYWGRRDNGRLCQVFGSVNPGLIEPNHLLIYFERRSSQAMAKKEIKFLSVLFNWGISRGMISCPNPTTHIMRLLKVNEKKDIYVDDGSFDLVFKHADQLIRDAMTFTYICGNRPNESECARKSDIDGDELVIHLAKTRKRGNPIKRLKIDGDLKSYIEKQKEKVPSSVYLVSDERGQPLRTISMRFRRAWDKAREDAEKEAEAKGLAFTRFALMDLRAKAATDMCAKHGIEAARVLLGHTTQKQTADYIRSVAGANSATMDKLLQKSGK